jgi:hypothetical protein
MAVLNKSQASLRIFGDDLEPDQITRMLGKDPTRSDKKGEPRSWVPNRPIARTGSWSLKAPSCEPGNLDPQIKEIFHSLTPDLNIWAELTSRFKAELFCGLFMKEWNEGECLSAESLYLLGSRSIPIGLDIYGPDVDE